MYENITISIVLHIKIYYSGYCFNRILLYMALVETFVENSSSQNCDILLHVRFMTQFTVLSCSGDNINIYIYIVTN